MILTPPFRADQVGSLLRPPELKQARAQVERGEMSAAELTALEDRLILVAVARQEALGLRSVTDGEYRRGWWNHDFLGRIDGVDIELDGGSYKFVGSDDPRYTPKVRRKLSRPGPMMVEHFRYLNSIARNTAKFTLPSPSILYHRGGPAAISREAYPGGFEELVGDVGRVYQQEIRDLAAAGLRYLQIDDVSFSFLCDEKFRASCRARGDDPDRLPHLYARAVNTALAVTGAERTPMLPEVPTMAEAGVDDFVLGALFGVFVPAGAPPQPVEALARELAALSASAQFRKRLIEIGQEVTQPLAGRAFGDYMRAEAKRWRELAQLAGVED